MKHLNKLLLIVATVLTAQVGQAADECIKVKSCNYDFQCEVYHYTGDWQLIGVTDTQADSEVECMSNTMADAGKPEPKLARSPSAKNQH